MPLHDGLTDLIVWMGYYKPPFDGDTIIYPYLYLNTGLVEETPIEPYITFIMHITFLKEASRITTISYLNTWKNDGESK